MKDKTKENWRKLTKRLKEKKSIALGLFLGMVIISVLISSVVFYSVGKGEGYRNKEYEIAKMEKNKDIKELTNILYKEPIGSTGKILFVSFSVALIRWMPLIFLVIGISWIVHGVGFRII